jgi:hypothetical protein
MRWIGVWLVLLTACGPQRVVRRSPPELHAAQNAAWTRDIKAVAQPGDWFVIRGYKKADTLVVMATNIPLSHAAIYDPEHSQVIEATGAGVAPLSFKKFVDKSHHLLVIRPRWWTAKAGKEAVDWARSAVGRKYDYLGTVGINRKGRWYCSELCVFAYKKHHLDSERFPRVIEPGQMFLWGRILLDTGTRN